LHREPSFHPEIAFTMTPSATDKASLPGIKLFDLTGRVAVVTGGSKGLGLAMADGLASAGASVVLVSRHADEAGERAAEIQSRHGVRCMGLAMDVTSEEQTSTMAK